MNYLLQTIFITAMTLSSAYALEHFDIMLKPKWQELDSDCDSCSIFGGKWIVVGSITFKKFSKEPISIKTINLHWNGQKIDNLVASLYRKNLDKEFLAIEDNLICDGSWNDIKQTLILDFDEPEKLAPRSVFYLVLTVPTALEPVIKKGSFSLENSNLPKPFKECARDEKLELAINDHKIR